MDTPTLVILSLILVITTVVVFFGVRWLLTSVFVRPPRGPKVFLPTLDQTMPQSIQTLSDEGDSGRPVVVSLPKFSGQGENINMDEECWLTGKRIRDCIKDCNCEEFAKLRQKQHGRAQQW